MEKAISDAVSAELEKESSARWHNLGLLTAWNLTGGFMQVTIDGVPYAPASVVSSRIGIAISTHQRADVLKRALEQHMKHLPPARWWWLSMMVQNLQR
jgi:hypothetical protein